VQEFKYAPKLTDNDSKVSCSLKSGESSDEFDLTVLTLESLSNNGKSASQFKYEVNDLASKIFLQIPLKLSMPTK